MKNKILIYGANGYVGKLLVAHWQHKEIELILGARTAFNSKLETRIFALDNEDVLIENLNDVKLIINVAGPFSNTNKAFIEACILTKTHYIDIAGEYEDFATVYKYNEVATKTGIMIMPGAGFGVVPTDIVANYAKSKLTDATHLKIAYQTIGGASRGTLKTVLKDINKNGVVLKDNKYLEATPGTTAFNFNANGKSINTVYNPWRADLFTAKISTGIANIETYASFPGFIVKMMQGKMLWLRNIILNKLINLFPLGPNEKQLKSGSTICYAEVKNNSGASANAYLIGPEAYLFTAQAVMAISKYIIDGNFKPGFQTPNIYSASLLKDIPNITIQ